MTKQTDSKTKVENLGKMPKLRFRAFNKEWEEFKLKDIAKMYDGTHQTPKYVQQGIPFYSVENVTANNFSKTKYIAKDIFEKENKRVKIEQGDILMTRIGDIGTAKYIDWNVQASFYVSLALIKPNKSYSGQYIAHYISTNKFQSELWNRTIHVAFPKKINLGEIGECLINIPCSSEQNQIAACLSLIDERIECQRKIINQLDTAMRIIREKIFKQQIKFRDKNGKHFPGWDMKTLGEIANIRSGLSKEQNSKSEGCKVTRIETISNGEINVNKVGFIDISDNIDEYKLRKGDILFSNINSVAHIGKTAIAFSDLDIYHGMNLLCIKSKSDVNPLFLFYYLNTIELRNYFKKICNQAVSQASINQSELSNTRLSLPCFAEQNQIANFLTSLDAKIETEKQLLEQYKQQKTYLLQNLFI